MPQGLQVFDAAGNLQFSATDYLPRIMGSFLTGTTVGSLNIPNFLTNKGFAFIYPLVSAPQTIVHIPRVVYNSSGFSWDWDAGLTSLGYPKVAGIIMYGRAM